MTDPIHHTANLIFSAGTQVVVLRNVVSESERLLHPRGAVGIVVQSPIEPAGEYRVRFLDGVEETLGRDEISVLARFKEGALGETQGIVEGGDLYRRVFYQCIVGSRAYGLEDDGSDTDRRGIFLPSADDHWSLCGVPPQIERRETQEHYWEVQRFLVLALKANPNVLECLYTPLVEHATPLAEELLAIRSAFLSRIVYSTFDGYVMSQFKKMQAGIRNRGEPKWKHVMHLIRLLISGIRVLREGIVPVRVEAHREELLAIRRGEVSWDETEALAVEIAPRI